MDVAGVQCDLARRTADRKVSMTEPRADRDETEGGEDAGLGGAERPTAPEMEHGRPSPEAVWSYRGYELGSRDFTTAMVHLFRAEVNRANTWRMRLDATTNWAVITTGAAISVAFTSRSAIDHGVIILNTLLVTIFLMTEARRYRYYELWSYRSRLMETDFFAAMLVPPFKPAPNWAESLADNLLDPRFPITFGEAFGRRFRRNYMYIYLLLAVAWALKIWLHPEPAGSMEVFFERASIGNVPGALVVGIGLAFNIVLLVIGWLTVGLQESAGEVLSRYEGILAEATHSASAGKGSSQAPRTRKPGWLQGPKRPTGVDGSRDRSRGVARRRRHQREQLVTFVITSRPEEVSRRLMEDLHRGVTAMPATGMYSGSDRAVLLCALTVTEVGELRHIVESVDPDGFVVVSPAAQVLGEGFAPLEEDEAAG